MYTMQERIGRQMGAQQFAGTVMAALGVVAILLTLLGAYVLADSMASVRMREMGIRAALGATRRQLGSIVLTQTARLVGIGIMAGLALAWLGANMIRAFLFRGAATRSHDVTHSRRPHLAADDGGQSSRGAPGRSRGSGAGASGRLKRKISPC